MLIAQISDLHFHLEGRYVDLIRPKEHLAAAVAALNALRLLPDLVLVTGDLTEHGRPEEYEGVGAVLSELRMPWLPIPGNHDSVEHMRAAFPDMSCLHNDTPFIQYAIEDLPLRIIALDTVVPGASHGALCERRLGWLARTLEIETEKPTVIMMHHPPIETGIRGMDGLALQEGRETFLDLIAEYDNIERIACGHVHRSVMCRLAGTVVSICPGIAHQITLDLEGDPNDLQFIFEPPGYQLHWFGDNGLVTHHGVIGDHGQAIRYE